MAVVAVLLLGAALPPGAVAHADTPGYVQCTSYEAQSAADGIRVSFHGDNVLPLTNDADAEGPSAAALVSLGVSSGVAGAPYPGSAAMTAISLAGGTVQGNGGPGFDSSSYPLAATTQYPTHPDSSVSAGALSLTSKSGAGNTRAEADGGGTAASSTGSSAGATSTSASASCLAGGRAQADSSTDNDVLSFGGGVLRIGRIHSFADASTGAAGKVTLSSGLDVGQATVAGQTVDVTGHGITAGPQPVALPDQAATVLQSAGITIYYVRSQNDPDNHGVMAAGLLVAVTAPLSQEGVGTSPSTVTYTFGRAYARIDSSGGTGTGADVAASLGANGLSTGVPPSTGVTGLTGSAGVPSAATEGYAAGGGGSPGSLPSVSPLPIARSTGSTPASTTRAGSTPAGGTSASFSVAALDWSSAYLALLIGALVFAGGFLLQHRIRREM